MHIRVLVSESDFQLENELSLIRQQSREIGAIASFVGLVREVNDDDSVSSLFLEHYPGMTEKSLAKIAYLAGERWDLIAATIIHRVGKLEPSDQIVLVLAASSHRKDALNACDFMMDYLKTQAPFWKKEMTAKGEQWLSSRESDTQAASAWDGKDNGQELSE